MGVADQFGAGFVAEDDLLIRHEQHQQNGRVPGQGQPGPLARGVDDHVEIAGPGTVRDPAGPVPGRVPFVLLETHRRSLAANAVGHAGQAGDELRWFQAQAHLVPVVLATDRGAVHTRSHLDPQDQPFFGAPASLLRGMRVSKTGRQFGGASNEPGQRFRHGPLVAGRITQRHPISTLPPQTGILICRGSSVAHRAGEKESRSLGDRAGRRRGTRPS